MTTDTVGWVWRYTINLAGALAHRGWQVRLATFGPPPDAAQRAEVDSLPGVMLVAGEFPLDWAGADRDAMQAAAAELADMVRREACDLAHLHAPLLAAAADWTVPLVGLIHACGGSELAAGTSPQLVKDSEWHWTMTRQGLEACDRLVAPTLASAAMVSVDRPVKVIYNGSSPHLPVGPERKAPFVFTAGRLWDETRNVALLDAVAGKLDVPFLAAGEQIGPGGQKLKARNLRLLGSISMDEINAHLSQRPVFVSAAQVEPFGLGVLEAAESGCALVLSDIPAFRELWGGAATFVDPHDEAGFLSAIEMLIQDADLRHKVGAAACCRAMDYSLRAMTDAMVSQYEGVLEEEHSAAQKVTSSAIRH
ncbi:hypothetical protein LK12_15590 [Novosphingobium malaysiense]|uniref:Uncharacterized protein n=2 Tax=Novosphingobium malaysiense TaxID=1348853 RepID=A0A0B1ZNE5_9SPHN|nr:hypothetical protein LK12_15590 [Novosphingobium malaysiense]